MRREDELAELAQRSELALKMGGADQIRAPARAREADRA